ncbi:MAG TPA: hypothetical protein VGC49_09595 [Solirubrobacterales bacterium]|jgi:hypothetical protein
MNHDETPINGRPERPRRIRAAAESVSLAVEEHVLWRGGDALKVVFEVVRRSFDRLVWVIQRGLIWPLEDRSALLSGPARALASAAVLLVAVAAVVGGAVLASSGGSEQPAATTATLAAAKPPLEVPASSAAESTPEPTLHGAAPVFEPSGKKSGGSGVEAEEPVPPTPPRSPATTSSSASPATDKISSVPSPSAGDARASTSAVEARPAGPAAIAVAREFAAAFVLYETGGDKAEVRKAFGATATSELSRSLLRRPPRLPAKVKVPKAKVVNVVAGPSQGGIYSVSVSLLRVGVTSELRLAMERLKNHGWRVTNVLG